MKISRKYTQDLLKQFTIMEAMLCEMLAMVNMERERFRAVIDLADENQARRDVLEGRV